MSKYARRVDTNQSPIFRLWRDLGAEVTDTSRFGEGFPDCQLAYRGRILLAEIKFGKNGLTPEQAIFHKRYETHGVVIPIVRTEDDALAVLGARRSA